MIVIQLLLRLVLSGLIGRWIHVNASNSATITTGTTSSSSIPRGLDNLVKHYNYRCCFQSTPHWIVSKDRKCDNPSNTLFVKSENYRSNESEKQYVDENFSRDDNYYATKNRGRGTRADSSRSNMPIVALKTTTRTSTSNPYHTPSITLNKDPEIVEQQLNLALDSMKSTWSLLTTDKQKSNIHNNSNNNNKSEYSETGKEPNFQSQVIFPTARECNTAIAAFGDSRNLLRALRMFGKMRKASALYNAAIQRRNINSNKSGSYNGRNSPVVPLMVPSPTLVTYSTLMSRAVKLDKPIVALRLWNLMISSSYSSNIQQYQTNNNVHQQQAERQRLEVDVKAANILMNCYAKLADVESAKQLLIGMKLQQGPESESATKETTPMMKPKSSNNIFSKIQLPSPNLVTYNTFLNACHKANDLDSAVDIVQEMMTGKNPIKPDERTYTTLIATVARKSCRTSGKNDPTPAFSLLRDMIHEQKLRPNGITYSALIDVCSRCNRSDLALHGLRMMLQQKAQEKRLYEQQQQQENKRNNARYTEENVDPNIINKHDNMMNKKDDQNHPSSKYTLLPNEVGAWTAAINACGKAGRVDTALRLFYAMYPNFGVQPNTVTCGSLTDSLLRVGRTADTLEILRYMKRNSIIPSDVMYTSLMSRAGKLVRMENKKQKQEQRGNHHHNHHISQNENVPDQPSTEQEATEFKKTSLQDAKAIEVYTELIKSLSNKDIQLTTSNNPKKSNDNRNSFVDKGSASSRGGQETLLKTFLVFQEMKDVGAKPDLTCFNALLSACSKAGDVTRAQFVLRQMQDADIDPSDTSWRQVMRAAAAARNAGSKGVKATTLQEWNIANDEVTSSNIQSNNNVESIWKQALSYRRRSKRRARMMIPDDTYRITPVMWKPGIESLYTLFSSYMRQASESIVERTNGAVARNSNYLSKAANCYSRILHLYEDVLMGINEEMGMDRIDVNLMLESSKVMVVVLQAAVALEDIVSRSSTNSTTITYNQSDIRRIASSIAKLECFQEQVSASHQRISTINSSQPNRMYGSAQRALDKAKEWIPK
jgi:pentatricopeptide repeat protein